MLFLQCLEECDSHGLPPTEQGRLDLELKMEDTKENMRKAEVCMLLISSQLSIDQGCPNYSTKARVAAGFCFNQSSTHRRTNQMSEDSDQLIK